MAPIQILALETSHLDDCIALWSAEGMGYESDLKERVTRLIEAQPGLSKVALVDDRIVGAVLCSYNEFSYYLFRLVVHADERSRGTGTRLLTACELTAKEAGAAKIMLHAGGATAHWCERLGYYRTSGNLMFKLLP